jgi:hypothetical protein
MREDFASICLELRVRCEAPDLWSGMTWTKNREAFGIWFMQRLDQPAFCPVMTSPMRFCLAVPP